MAATIDTPLIPRAELNEMLDVARRDGIVKLDPDKFRDLLLQAAAAPGGLSSDRHEHLRMPAEAAAAVELKLPLIAELARHALAALRPGT